MADCERCRRPQTSSVTAYLTEDDADTTCARHLSGEYRAGLTDCDRATIAAREATIAELEADVGRLLDACGGAQTVDDAVRWPALQAATIARLEGELANMRSDRKELLANLEDAKWDLLP